jgi:hypothetical protein
MASPDKTSPIEYSFEILQGDRVVATVTKTSLVIARQRATHLALAYAHAGTERIMVRGINGITLTD